MPQPEVWLRGALTDVAPLLQPVAHSLLQSREEVAAILSALTLEGLSTTPNGSASVGFHVRHAAGSLDRLLSYARGERLSAAQLQALSGEEDVPANTMRAADLSHEYCLSIDQALAQIRGTREDVLLEPRGVGRAQLPSTVLGLLVHAAEHTQRHAGQAITIAKIVLAARPVDRPT